MIFFTHLALGVLLGIIYIKQTAPGSVVSIFLTIILASLIPDIDISTSYLGRNIKPINDFFQHRKFFHSISFMVFGAIGAAYLFDNPDFGVAYILGFSGHLFLDSLTRGGLYAFWPSRLSIKGVFTNNSAADWALCAVFIMLSAYIIYANSMMISIASLLG